MQELGETPLKVLSSKIPSVIQEQPITGTEADIQGVGKEVLANGNPSSHGEPMNGLVMNIQDPEAKDSCDVDSPADHELSMNGLKNWI